MKSVGKITTLISLLLLAACSSSPKTQVVQLGDNQLTTGQIQAELAKLDQQEREINRKKGLNVTNTAAFLFWWPGLAYTYYDANEALKLIEQRRSYLATLQNQKQANPFNEQNAINTKKQKSYNAQKPQRIRKA
ncbi:MAG: hypothetical protein JSS07_10555 [Proteobacteria bacterium]|nr:hypothetical protein [Pseudomonadota bacterium]